MPHIKPATVLIIAVVALVVGAALIAAGLTFNSALLSKPFFPRDLMSNDPIVVALEPNEEETTFLRQQAVLRHLSSGPYT